MTTFSCRHTLIARAVQAKDNQTSFMHVAMTSCFQDAMPQLMRHMVSLLIQLYNLLLLMHV